MNNQIQKYTFYIQGMHCNACVLLTESELSDLPNITRVKSSLKNHSVEVDGDFGDKTLEQIAEELTRALKPHGYTVCVERPQNKVHWSDFKIAVPLALVFAVLFVGLQKIGLVNLVGSGKITYGMAFVVGLVASLSTCMAVVGGLVLSMSATFAKEGGKIQSQLMFHGGRVISFFIFGGVIGAFGSAFALNASAIFILALIVGVVMLILGINLLDIFSWTKKLQPAMPKFIAREAHRISKFNSSVTPLLVGVATFFLPCGFTQSMQFYTLTTGSFLAGGFTMLAFALGTLPVLAIVSFSSFSFQKSSKAGIFFKTAGLIIIMFAIFNLINSLVVIGFISPIFNF